MILTIQQIMDSFEGELSDSFKNSLGKLDPTTEIIRKQIPASMLRFEEGETAILGVITDIRQDRDQEVVFSKGMDDSNYSGVVLWQHDYYREAIPHARSMYRQLNPKGNPYEVLAKTQYITDISDLGSDVYEYRKAEHPLGQSIGFRSIESVRKEQTGYDEVYKDWKVRCKAMLKEKGIKPTADEFNEPWRFYTKWELWEYSDVFIGSNPDALQVAVNKGVLTPEEAKLLVAFDVNGKTEEPDQISELLQRVTDLEAEIEEMKKGSPAFVTNSLAEMWDQPITTDNSAKNNWKELWNGNEA